jgi:hypothetical protein
LLAWHDAGMSELRHADSIVVAATPDEVYDLVADVTNMGTWSPVCAACWYDEGAGPEVGAWFTGRNELPERTWETRSRVVAADRGREFAFVVTEMEVARWGYLFEPVDGGTRVTETWEFLPGGHAFFEQRYGDEADAQIAARAELARTGIPATLAAIKQSAEA